MNIKTFVKSLFKSEDSITLESVYILLLETRATQAKQQELIEQLCTKSSTNNLTVISQKPVAEGGKILNALARKRKDSDFKAEAEDCAKRLNIRMEALKKHKSLYSTLKKIHD